MRRSDFIKLGLVILLGLSACAPVRRVESGTPEQPAAPLPAGTAAPTGLASPGVLTALPALPTMTRGSQPAAARPAANATPLATGAARSQASATGPAGASTEPAANPQPGLSLPPTEPVPPLPTPTLACDDGLRYLSDLTIPDGTLVAAGDVIDKRWQVENSGTCNWNESYRLRRISGEALGVPDELALYPARSGTQAVIRIVFTAPAEPGTYRSAWQAYNPQGQPFGDPVFVEIIVGAGSP